MAAKKTESAETVEAAPAPTPPKAETQVVTEFVTREEAAEVVNAAAGKLLVDAHAFHRGLYGLPKVAKKNEQGRRLYSRSECEAFGIANRRNKARS